MLAERVPNPMSEAASGTLATIAAIQLLDQSRNRHWMQESSVCLIPRRSYSPKSRARQRYLKTLCQWATTDTPEYYSGSASLENKDPSESWQRQV